MDIQTGSISEIKSTYANSIDSSLLASLAKSAEILTTKQGWSDGINALLADLGRITKVSRVWIFQILELDSEQITQDYAFEWASEPKYIQLGLPVFKKFTNKLGSGGYRKLVESRSKGEWQKVITSKLPDSWLKTSQVKQNIQSMLTIPIIVENSFWGVLGFDDCEREYDWSEIEINLLRIASFFISSAILQNKLSSREKQFSILQKILSTGAWEYNIQSKHLWSSSGKASPDDDPETERHFSLFEFLMKVHRDDRRILIKAIDIFFKSDKDILSHDLRVMNENGTFQWIEIIGSLVRDSNGNPSKISGILIQADIRKNLEIKLKKEAETDDLTGILNRRIFWKKLKHQINKSKNRNSKFSLLIFDIDHFKHVNDTWGHPAGDKVLKHFTTLCLKELRDGDIFARVGGEEFALLLQNSTEKIALKVGERIRSTVESTPCITGNEEINITVSGVCVTCHDKKINSDSLYKNADESLFEAKNSGRNRIICYPKK